MTMEMLFDVLGFALKALLVFLTIVVTTAVVIGLSRRGRRAGLHLEVKPLNRRFEALADALRSATMGRRALKKLAKARKKLEAAEQDDKEKQPRVFVLDFDGDILARPVRGLREEVSAIVGMAAPGDEVLVRLESPGGAVPHYGLAAAQLVRLRDKKIKVTVAIDRMAASGGYMMACVADEILAAPFAIIGSIGVVASVPNLHRLLKAHNIDYDEMTAGEFKRTVSLFGEISDKGKQKFQDQLDEMHGLFKAFVKEQRPKLDIDQVATGEYWLARRALELGLVDRLMTSDDHLLARSKEARLFQVIYKPARSFRDRVGEAAASILQETTSTVLSNLNERRWG